MDIQADPKMALPILPTETTPSGIRSLTKQLAAMATSPRIVKLELILTEACNLSCTYCFEYHADHGQSMSLETARGAVDFLMAASRDSTWVGITFMGGEPMLRFGLIQEVINYAKEGFRESGKRVAFDMQTNGLLIREEHARIFHASGLKYCLSLDGMRATNDRHRRTPGGSGTFQIVARKMPLLKRYQPWQGVRMTIMPEDAGALAANISELHEGLGINQFILGFATHVQWSDLQIADYAKGLCESFDYFLNERVAKKSRRLRISLFELGGLEESHVHVRHSSWGCGAGSGRLAVLPSGDLHGCSKLAWGPEGSRKSALPLGSVATGISVPENRDKLLDHTATPRAKCHSCEIANSCQGGCYATNYADTGNIYIPADYFCKLMFAQKYACDYARSRLRVLGLKNLFWSTDVPDLADPLPVEARTP